MHTGQCLKSIDRLRGKSQILQETKEVSSQDDPHDHTPKTHWEEYSILENAKRAKDDVSQIITELHKTAGLGEHPFIHGVGIGLLSVKPPNPAVNPDAAR